METTVFWLGPLSSEAPAGALSSRVERARVLVVPLEDVPEVPRQTQIQCAEYDGGELLDWVVDSTVGVDVDSRRVAVVPAPTES